MSSGPSGSSSASIKTKFNEKLKSRYTGKVDNTIRHGVGVYDYDLGGNSLFTYSGDYKHGLKAGAGTFNIKGFCEYVGTFVDGEITGNGCRRWADGRIYTGEFLLGEMNGVGRYSNSTNTEVYEGEMKCNQRSGQGLLRKDNDVYKGTFLNHKFNGIGTYLRENAFVVTADNFIDNVINGSSGSITWHKIAHYEGSITNGIMMQKGYYHTHDNSYVFDGDFDDGFCVDNQCASYSWCDIDRSKVVAYEAPVVEAAAGGKDKKPAAKAAPIKKGEVPVNEIIIPIGPDGGELGLLVVRAACALTEDEIEAIKAAAQPPAKGGKAPIQPAHVDIKNPIPAVNALVHERLRKCTARIKQITGNPTDLPLQINEETAVPFWLKKRSLKHFIDAKDRFPLTCLLFHNGIITRPITAASSSSSTAHSIVLNGDIGNAQDVDALAVVTSSNQCVATIDWTQLAKASEAMTYVIDFRLNSNSDDYITQRLHSISSTSDNGCNGTIEIVVLSLNRAYGDEQVKSSQLQLVLLVPTASVICSSGADYASIGGEETIEKTPTYNYDSWDHCVWELRLVVEDSELKTTTTSCAMWNEGSSFRAQEWHSVGCTLAKKGVDLIVDGCGKVRLNSSSISSSSSSDDGVDGILQAWLPEEISSIPESNGGIDSSTNDTAVDGEQATVALTLMMMVTVSGSTFNGCVSYISVLTPADRCDITRITGAYASYKLYEAEWAATKDMEAAAAAKEQESPDNQDAEVDATANATHGNVTTQVAVTIPYNMQAVNECDVSLVCGSGDQDLIVMPSNTPTGYYLIQISDGVSPDCLIDGLISRRSSDCPIIDKPADLANKYRLVKRMESTQILIKIENNLP